MNTLLEAVEAFTVGQAGEVSSKTRAWYASRLSAFASWVGDVPLSKVTAATLRAYRAELVDRGLSPHTVHGHQRAIRRFFTWLAAEGEIPHNVARDVPLVRLPQQEPKAISEEDMRRLLDRLPKESPRDRAIVLLLADTGCRVGGLVSLTLDSLDLEGRAASVVEKGAKARRIYYTTPTAEALRLYLMVRPETDSRALFVTQAGKPITHNGIKLMLERVGKRAGVKGRVNPHSFRHSFARSFLKNGGNLAALGRILGHAPGSQVTAKYYAVWDDHELQEYHDKYSPLAVPRTDERRTTGGGLKGG